MREAAWRDRPRILCPSWEPETCDCGSVEFEQRGNSQRLAVRCKRCGDVEIESPLAIILAQSKASSTAGTSDYQPSAPNGENAGYRNPAGGHGE